MTKKYTLRQIRNGLWKRRNDSLNNVFFLKKSPRKRQYKFLKSI